MRHTGGFKKRCKGRSCFLLRVLWCLFTGLVWLWCACCEMLWIATFTRSLCFATLNNEITLYKLTEKWSTFLCTIIHIHFTLSMWISRNIYFSIFSTICQNLKPFKRFYCSESEVAARRVTIQYLDSKRDLSRAQTALLSVLDSKS